MPPHQAEYGPEGVHHRPRVELLRGFEALRGGQELARLQHHPAFPVERRPTKGQGNAGASVKRMKHHIAAGGPAAAGHAGGSASVPAQGRGG